MAELVGESLELALLQDGLEAVGVLAVDDVDQPLEQRLVRRDVRHDLGEPSHLLDR